MNWLLDSYAHYYDVHDWNKPEWQKAWPQLIEDISIIVDASGVYITGPTKGEDVATPVLADVDRGIYLNGVGDDEVHESFVLRKDDFEWVRKTARKPYDIVVTCISFKGIHGGTTHY